MIKFTEGVDNNELLAYCIAFGIVIGMMLGFFIGAIYSNGFIMAMGPTIGIFIGLAAWFILADQADY
ncbi:hypothetical protein G6M89_16865 [Natronolimnobius sp. AArcel1]|uniref:hypothetical protein n=1 Tax=Natronolimnobius sp. AArcel1 TaxID=1679093 RepID=UPI0013EC6887|nr:hypothetical protein [Natronolimnobius sp. AArcel1]NGM70656.1 hypothetical protein [Natronolimnobius sp. AArcel1]